MISFKETLRRNLPSSLRRLVWPWYMKAKYRAYRSMTTQEIFTKIYDEGIWGKSEESNDRYYSGGGSRDQNILQSYASAIETFLSRFEGKPDVVDLGCGDFTVGSKVRHLCGRYTACDIVPSLVEYNKTKYHNLEVEFRCVDITTDPLPDGEIVFIKEVFQHLSNNQIRAALSKIQEKYKYLVFTEELPKSDNFKQNVDKPAGPNTRIGVHSGIILTSSPFSLNRQNQEIIFEMTTEKALIKTIVYKIS